MYSILVKLVIDKFLDKFIDNWLSEETSEHLKKDKKLIGIIVVFPCLHN